MTANAEQLSFGNIIKLTEVDRIAMRLAARRIKHAKLGSGIVARVEPGQYAPELVGSANIMNPRWKRRRNLALQVRGVPPGTPTIIKFALVEDSYDIESVAPEALPLEVQDLVAQLVVVLGSVLEPQDVLEAALFIARDFCSLLGTATQDATPARVGSWRFKRAHGGATTKVQAAGT